MKKIKIILIEDNRLLRDSITALIKKQTDISVVANVPIDENIVTVIEKNKPEIVLLDLSLRNQNSLEVAELIKKHFRDIKIIVINIMPLQMGMFEFVQAGVWGFILKDANVTEFCKTIRSVYMGAKVLPANLTGVLFSQIVKHGFAEAKPSAIIESLRMTKRERQVIELVTEGLTNKEIAEKLHMSICTVKSHVHNILEKLTLHTRVQIAKYASTTEPFKTAIETHH